MQTNNQALITEFIENIWNQSAFDKMEDFIHPQFHDHSLPASIPTDANGLKQWITATSVSFEHKTIIEDQVTEGNKSVVKIRMDLKHIGTWRNILPTGKAFSTVGYRLFRISDGKIIEHWALIDGQTIESQLKEAAHGCKVAE